MREFFLTCYQKVLPTVGSLRRYYGLLWGYLQTHVQQVLVPATIFLHRDLRKLWGNARRRQATVISHGKRFLLRAMTRPYRLKNRYRIACTAVAMLLLAFAGGYHTAPLISDPDEIARLQTQVHQYAAALDDIREMRLAEEELLLRKVALMQAQLTRMEALGDYLLEQYGLSSAELNFSNAPGVGGMFENEADDSDYIRLSDISGKLESHIDNTRFKLEIMSQLLKQRDLHAERLPFGWPVSRGIISSRYAYRINPFVGRREFHHGIDIAGAQGSPVRAVASGIVERRVEGHKYYGHFVEIRHADGYHTLYAHNQSILVHKGDMIKKGQPIALLGSSGRSTGPHVHFEVIKDGRRINPEPFLLGAKR